MGTLMPGVWSWKRAKVEKAMSWGLALLRGPIVQTQRPALLGEMGKGQTVWDWGEVGREQLGRAGQKWAGLGRGMGGVRAGLTWVGHCWLANYTGCGPAR